MCTIVNSRISKKSKNDLVCFKIIELRGSGNGYMTPYQHFLISEEVLNGDKPLVAENKTALSEESNGYKKYWSVTGGYIHTFSYFDYAKRSLMLLRSNYPGSIFKLFKCIIPKGTKYYEGSDNGYKTLNTYASEKIIFVEQIIY